ncbi:host attachment protein [Paraburkholderia tropica]|uniref:host attachment protein n=1 Tax=Paraburkholderia tropica TaxID=92647 RepID=UPI002AB71C0D|nr:host attachment protein [Paraburkholderia tropica]
MEFWIVVANQTAARIFEAQSPSSALVEKRALVHPASRLKEGDLVSDAPGTTYDRFGEGRHRSDPDSSQRDREMVVFATEIAAALREAVLRDGVGTLLLVAPATFLGVLRRRLDANTLQRVTLEVNKDLVRFDAWTIRSRLPEFLPRRR